MPKKIIHSLFVIVSVGVLIAVWWWVSQRPVEPVETAPETPAEVSDENDRGNEPVETSDNPTSEPTENEPVKSAVDQTALIDHRVPFMVQAPTGEWSDSRQQDGCEEASALMAIGWVRGTASPSAADARRDIVALADFQQDTYGEHRDVSLEDIKTRIFEDYFSHDNVEVKTDITAEDIKKALYEGNVVIAPFNGQKLNNPYFSGAGPERHMLLIRGYDPKTDEFITNDPGTRRGENYRYAASVIMNAILVYPTGYHAPADESLKAILVVGK